MLNDENDVQYSSTLIRDCWKMLNVEDFASKYKHKRTILGEFLHNRWLFKPCHFLCCGAVAVEERSLQFLNFSHFRLAMGWPP